MKIGMRLSIGFAIILAILAVVAIISYTNIIKLDSSIENTVRDKYPKTTKVYEIKGKVNDIARRIRIWLSIRIQK
jgi:methyl-accepting chemotaxis protein